MPPIEMGLVRPISAGDIRLPRSSGSKGDSKSAVETPIAAVAISDALEPGQPPVDVERVAMIRKAVEQGTYPILPAKVADAVIAAGLLLRTGQ